MPWKRYRFQANLEDPRPVIFPPPGPWWCTGTSDAYSTVVAYLPVDVDLKKYWPEAEDITYTDYDDIVYSDRFPKPSWYKQ
jgi:hypothetical protein